MARQSVGREQERQLRRFTYATLAQLSEATSPFESFKNMGRSVVSLFTIAIVGLPFAVGTAGLVLDIYILLLVPAGVMAFASSLTTPLLRLFWRAEEGAQPFLRAVYDYVALLTAGLPYAEMWFWEGKILGAGLMLLSGLSLSSVVYGVAFLVTTMVGASVIYSLIARFMPLVGGGALTVFERVMRTIDFTFSIWVSYAFNITVYLILFGKNALAGVYPVMGFLLSLLSLDAFKSAVPKIGGERIRVPVTWNIVALLIGLSALMGTDFWVYAVAMVVIYLFMLYVISGDPVWAWYAIVAMPMSVPTAYYLGYITKLLLPLSLPVASLIVGAVPLAFVISVLIVLIIMTALLVFFGFSVGGFVGGFVAIFIGIVMFVLMLSVLGAILGAIDLVKEVPNAVNYLVSPA